MNEGKLTRKCRFLLCRLTMWLLWKKFGKDAVDYWAWNCTCYPFDIPLWGQIWDGIRLWDGSLSWRRLGERIDKDMREALQSLT